MIGSGLGVGPGDRTEVANFCGICGIYGLISVESAKSADQAAEIFHFCRSLV
jgi:hypothetical protein